MHLEKKLTWESVFRVRVSLGWKVKFILGNYSVKSTTLLSLPNCDSGNSLLYCFKLAN